MIRCSGQCILYKHKPPVLTQSSLIVSLPGTDVTLEVRQPHIKEASDNMVWFLEGTVSTAPAPGACLDNFYFNV